MDPKRIPGHEPKPPTPIYVPLLGRTESQCSPATEGFPSHHGSRYFLAACLFCDTVALGPLSGWQTHRFACIKLSRN